MEGLPDCEYTDVIKNQKNLSQISPEHFGGLLEKGIFGFKTNNPN